LLIQLSPPPPSPNAIRVYDYRYYCHCRCYWDDPASVPVLTRPRQTRSDLVLSEQRDGETLPRPPPRDAYVTYARCNANTDAAARTSHDVLNSVLPRDPRARLIVEPERRRARSRFVYDLSGRPTASSHSRLVRANDEWLCRRNAQTIFGTETGWGWTCVASGEPRRSPRHTSPRRAKECARSVASISPVRGLSKRPQNRTNRLTVGVGRVSPKS